MNKQVKYLLTHILIKNINNENNTNSAHNVFLRPNMSIMTIVIIKPI